VGIFLANLKNFIKMDLSIYVEPKIGDILVATRNEKKTGMIRPFLHSEVELEKGEELTISGVYKIYDGWQLKVKKKYYFDHYDFISVKYPTELLKTKSEIREDKLKNIGI
jgi:hypothetical protein